MKAAVEMDRIQKTLEIVRDSVPGEMTADSRMARSLAADAIARARCKHQRQLIDKLAEADDECLAELREHWYSMREDIERDYKAGMIDQETYERLSGLWAERLEDGIRRRKYEDDYTQILDKVGMAVRDLQTSCADDYNRIAELWQEPRKQRKPRRVDLKDIRIPIDKRHRGEIGAAIEQVQKLVTARTIDADDIYDAADWIREQYKGIPRAALAGSVWIVDDNAQSFAKAYTNNFTPMSTIYKVEATAHKLYVTSIYRGRCEAKQIRTSLSDAAEAALKEKAGETA